MSDPLMPNGYTLQQITDCEHRGVKKGFKAKGTGCTCQSKHREQLYACDLHGSCTMNRYSKDQTEWICTTCTDVKPPGENNDSP
jgi:hypothetical protein